MPCRVAAAMLCIHLCVSITWKGNPVLGLSLRS